jgi:pimeloyl-ACP methyl ester carboxylesterase
MEPLWPRLPELTMPVTVVVGGRDEKFAALARRYAQLLPRAEVVTVPGAGHGLPREAPEALASVLQQGGDA